MLINDISSLDIPRWLDRILSRIIKPGRYTGGELNSILKDWHSVEVRLALAFPDIYDLGMSNLGIAILYDVVNQHPRMLAERVFSPWSDMEAAMREAGAPLFTLESKRPVAEFDVLGISLAYEQLYTNALNLLDLSGIPILASERGERHPLVIAGGHATFNPEPMAQFIDAFVIGEGEEVLVEILELVGRSKRNRVGRDWLLRELASLRGVYVPRWYQVFYDSDGLVFPVQVETEVAPKKVSKRIVNHLPYNRSRAIVPFLATAHDRSVIEIMRGCSRGCRFCQAGYVMRPVREVPMENALDEAFALLGVMREKQVRSMRSKYANSTLKGCVTIVYPQIFEVERPSWFR